MIIKRPITVLKTVPIAREGMRDRDGKPMEGIKVLYEYRDTSAGLVRAEYDFWYFVFRYSPRFKQKVLDLKKDMTYTATIMKENGRETIIDISEEL